MNLQEQTKQYMSYIQTHPVTSLTEEEFSAIYGDLISLLGEHNKLYYIQSAPIISDNQYDELFSYLKTAEATFPHMLRDDSPTQRLTYQLQENFAQAEHPVPLLSLENSYNAEDLKDRDKSLQTLLDKHHKLSAEQNKHIIEDLSLIAGVNAFLQTTEGSFLFQRKNFNAGELQNTI